MNRKISKTQLAKEIKVSISTLDKLISKWSPKEALSILKRYGGYCHVFTKGMGEFRDR